MGVALRCVCVIGHRELRNSQLVAGDCRHRLQCHYTECVDMLYILY